MSKCVGKLTALSLFISALCAAGPLLGNAPQRQTPTVAFQVAEPEALLENAGLDVARESSPAEHAAPEPEMAPANDSGASPSKTIISGAIVIVDCGQSMSWCCQRGGESRLAIAQWALYDLLDAVTEDLPTAILALQQEASQVWPLEAMTPDDKSQLRRFAMQLKPHGASALRKGFEAADRLLQERADDYTEIILLTDGQQCTAEAASALAALARRHRIHFDVIGICTDGHMATALRSLADVGNGSFSAVTSSKALTTALRGAKNRFEEVREQAANMAANCQRDLPLCRRERLALTRQLHETKSALHSARAEVAQCKSHQQQLKHQLETCQTELAAACAKNCELDKALGCCRQEKCQLENDLASVTSVLESTQVALARTQHDLLCETNALGCCQKELCAAKEERQKLEQRLTRCEHVQQDLEKKLVDAGNQHQADLTVHQADVVQHQADLTKIGEQQNKIASQQAALATSNTLAAETQKQLEACRFTNVQLTSWLEACRTEKATAIERVLGTTREMAAMKHDCCPVPNTQPIIAPVVTAPGNNPVGGGVGGSPAGGAPGGVAGGGPTGPGGAGGVAGGGPGVTGGNPGGIAGGSPGGVAGGSPGGVAGGSPGGVAGGSPGGVAGGSPGSSAGGGGAAGGSDSGGGIGGLLGDVLGTIGGLFGL